MSSASLKERSGTTRGGRSKPFAQTASEIADLIRGTTSRGKRREDLLVEVARQVAEAESTDDEQAVLQELYARGEIRFQRMKLREGGCVSGPEFAERLGVTRQRVTQLRKEGSILALPAGGGRFEYPLWQVQNGSLLPGLREALNILPQDAPLDNLSIFLGEVDELEGDSPLDMLRRGEVDLVLQFLNLYYSQG